MSTLPVLAESTATPSRKRVNSAPCSTRSGRALPTISSTQLLTIRASIYRCSSAPTSSTASALSFQCRSPPRPVGIPLLSLPSRIWPLLRPAPPASTGSTHPWSTSRAMPDGVAAPRAQVRIPTLAPPLLVPIFAAIRATACPLQTPSPHPSSISPPMVQPRPVVNTTPPT